MRFLRLLCYLYLVSCVFFLAPYVSAGAIPINATKSHGPLKTVGGVAVGQSISAEAGADAIRFLGKGGIIKFEQPSTSLVQDPVFKQIVEAGLLPLGSFSDSNKASLFADAFQSSFPGKKYFLELYSLDAGSIKALAQKYSAASVFGGGIWFIHRENMRNLNAGGVWPAMHALSMRLKPTNNDVFKNANLMLDTLYDAQKDIDGGTGIKMNFPSGSRLAVTEISAGNDEKGRAFRHSVMAAMLATSVQGGSAPLRYVIVSNFDSIPSSDRELIGRLLAVSNTNPIMAWPDAFSGNGDPYDNPFSDQWNTEPVMGIVFNTGGGKVFYVVNASGKNVTVNLQGASGNYKYISSTGEKGTIGSTTVALGPYEAKFIAPTIEEEAVVPTVSPVTPTMLPTKAPINTPVPTQSFVPTPTVMIIQPTQVIPTRFVPPIVVPTSPQIFPTTSVVVNKKIDYTAFAAKTDTALKLPLTWIDILRAYDRLFQLRILSMFNDIEQFVQRQMQ